MKEIDDAIELFESAYYVVPSYDSESGGTVRNTPEAPAFRSVRRLKRMHADYRHGPIKIYTKQEVAEYVKSKTVQRTNRGD